MIGRESAFQRQRWPQLLGAQEALIGSDPERFFRPPYVGVSGWVGVVLDTGPDWHQISDLVREAYNERGHGEAQERRERECASFLEDGAKRRPADDPSEAEAHEDHDCVEGR